MDIKKVCPVCGAENSPEFRYCMRCGAPLPETGNAQPGGYDPFGASRGAPPFTEPVTPPTDNDAVAVMIGIGNPAYTQKILNMRASGKKASWNWPVFLFGFLLGLPFVWFFYRKMYKQGWLALAASLILSLCGSGLLYGAVRPLKDAMEDAMLLDQSSGSTQHVAYAPADRPVDFDFDTDDEDDLFDDDFEWRLQQSRGQMIACDIGAMICAIGKLVLDILLAVFADGMYARHCDRRLETLRAAGRYDALSLRAAGGTAPGAAVGVAIGYTAIVWAVSAAILTNVLSSLLGAMLMLQ